MHFRGHHVLSTLQYDLDALEELFRLADILVPVAKGEMRTRVLEGAVLGSLFFEASTRTRLSFDTAFLRLGGSVSHTTGFTFSSISKGESIADTSRVISGYMDVVVMRHPEEQAIHDFAEATNIPVINGGNGAGEHPTQAFLDLYTIRREFARIDKDIAQSTIVFSGDLKYGRTVHSLMQLLAQYKGMRFILVSPKELALPEKYRNFAARLGHEIEESENLAAALRKADVIYATRIQKERFESEEVSENAKTDFRITKSLVDETCKKEAVILHPLPRDSRPGAIDLATDLDTDPRLAIFRQADNGVPVRMALFSLVLGVEKDIEKSLAKAQWWRPQSIGSHDKLS